MATLEQKPRTRRTPSRDADVALGTRAHMLIWNAGRTHTAVAEAIGMDSTGFGKKLKGKSGWALQEVIDLANELDTTIAYLFGETEEAPTPEGKGPKTSPSDYKPTVSPVISLDDFRDSKLSA